MPIALRGAPVHCGMKLLRLISCFSHMNRKVRTPTPLSCPTAPSSAGASTLPRGVSRALPGSGSEWEGDRSSRWSVFKAQLPLQYFYHVGFSNRQLYSAQRPRYGTAHLLFPAGRKVCPANICDVGSQADFSLCWSEKIAETPRREILITISGLLSPRAFV